MADTARAVSLQLIGVGKRHCCVLMFKYLDRFVQLIHSKLY